MKRILLKLSGEMLLGKQEYGVDSFALDALALEISRIHSEGVEIALVVGGGNIFRGIQGACSGIDRVSGDHMGMLATAFNGIALEQALLKKSINACVMSAFPMGSLTRPFHHREAIERLSQREVLLFVGGTGNPFFSTDSGAALRASEIQADVLLKATKVNGVYSEDPMLNPQAQHYPFISYQEVLEKNLKVMDPSAIVICRDNKLPIRIFKGTEEGQLANAVLNPKLGTIINQG